MAEESWEWKPNLGKCVQIDHWSEDGNQKIGGQWPPMPSRNIFRPGRRTGGHGLKQCQKGSMEMEYIIYKGSGSLSNSRQHGQSH